MARTAFLRAFTIALLFLLRVSQPLEAGVIAFGGDLASALGGPISTPTTLDAGSTPTFHFDSGNVTGVGRVIGDLVLANDTSATAGSITLTNFEFVSNRPALGGPVSFSIAVSQDFAYTGPPLVAGSEGLSGFYTFTAPVQSGLVTLSAAVNSSTLSPFVVSGLATGPSFPQSVPISPSAPGLDVVAPTAVHLDLTLGVSLSDNAVGNGPRVDLTNADVRYAAVPEPSTPAMCSIASVLVGLAYWWRRWKRAV